MMKQIHGSTPDQTYHAALSYMLKQQHFSEERGSGDDVSAWHYDVSVVVDDPLDSRLDLSSTGYVMPRRWNKLLKDYIDPESFLEFVDKALNAPKGVQVSYMTPSNYNHKWGNCLIAFTFHRTPNPRLKMFSRSTWFAPVGILDLALGCAVLKYLHRYHDMRSSSLVWDIGQAGFNSWKSASVLTTYGMFQNLADQTHVNDFSKFIRAIDLVSGKFSDPDSITYAAHHQCYKRWARARAYKRKEFTNYSLDSFLKKEK